MFARADAKRRVRRALLACMVFTCGSTFLWMPSCKGILTTFDPCGTILGNCEPGTFDLLFADVPDYDVDPTCTIPGGCTGDDPWEDPFGHLGSGAWPP